jgi:hypothetical protein
MALTIQFTTRKMRRHARDGTTTLINQLKEIVEIT